MSPSIFEEWNKNICGFTEYISFTLDEDFYILLNSGWRGAIKCVNYSFIHTNIYIYIYVHIYIYIYIYATWAIKHGVHFTIWTKWN